MLIALVGNQNCGKTTLFNQLTGSNQHVGNFPGVTVDCKIGQVRGQKDCQVADLPGIYSLRPYSAEEALARDFLMNQKPDVILNILDASNIERNLYLTCQLLEMRLPMVLALNMMDEVAGNGGSVDAGKLSDTLGVPAVPISAVKNEGVNELLRLTVEAARQKQAGNRVDFCSPGPVHRCIHAVSHVVEDHADRAGMSARFAATNVIEDNADILSRLDLDENEREMAQHAIVEMERERGLERNEALAEMRYAFIGELCRAAVKKPSESREHARSRRIDDILTNRFLAIPLFVLIMVLIFYLSFDLIGQRLSDLVGAGIESLTLIVGRALDSYGLNPVVRSLVVDGVFAGVGGVLSFLPIIMVLFLFLSLLEDSGYMARVAFVMDRPLRRIGLSGRSIVPMLIGFGCTVPAAMATRTLTSDRDRKMTVLLTPFMSCSAKIPVYSLFAAAFFPGRAAVVMIVMYVLGIVSGILTALLSRKTVFRGNPTPFVMENPDYRLPSLKTSSLLLWDKAKDFLRRAFTVIFTATVVIWFLQTFDLRLNVAQTPQASMLASLGRLIAPAFRPLGFGDWRAVTALVSGFMAKEAVVSTLAVLSGQAGIASVFTTAGAAAFLVFTLLYTPCVAAIAAIRREMSSRIATLGVIVYQCAAAYVMAFLAYRLMLLVL